jgi:rhomboid protease GluP
MTSTSPLSRESEPYVTRSLLAILIIIWILTVFANGQDQIMSALSQGPTVPQLLTLGGNLGELTWGRTQYWRLISACFLHIGFLHIAFNGWALAVFGPGLEKILGRGRFLLVYILTGIVGGIISATMNPSVVSAGASGAIFGLVGAIWSVLLRRKASSAAIQQIIWIVGLNFAWGLRPGSHIDNWAHGGGLAAGFLLGYVIPAKGDLRASWDRGFDVACGIVATALAVYGVGYASVNAWTLLEHPERAELQTVTGASGDYTIGIPANWNHQDNKGWDMWSDANGSTLIARRVPQEFAREASALNGAAKLTKDLMSGLLGDPNPDELSVLSSQSQSIGGSPAMRIVCFARLSDDSSYRFTADWLSKDGGSYMAALLTPVDVSLPDAFLTRIAGTIRPLRR